LGREKRTGLVVSDMTDEPSDEALASADAALIEDLRWRYEALIKRMEQSDGLAVALLTASVAIGALMATALKDRHLQGGAEVLIWVAGVFYRRQHRGLREVDRHRDDMDTKGVLTGHRRSTPATRRGVRRRGKMEAPPR
jgi:hypothetical protein